MAAGGAVAQTRVWAVETILARLTGDWLFEREIDNGVGVAGTAKLTLVDGGRLGYREDGRMRLADGQTLDAHAAYLFAKKADRLTLFFLEEPPRSFQSFGLTRAGDRLFGESVHDCPPDTYRSRIAFDPDGSWSLTHDVRGPRKAYVSKTLYRR